MKKSLYILLAVVFTAFAYVNLNDPDPVVWVLAYGAVAVLFACAAFGRADRRISGYLALALGMWMLTLVPEMLSWVDQDMPSIVTEMKATEPHIELVREFLGLLIAVLCLVGLWASTPRGARMVG